MPPGQSLFLEVTDDEATGLHTVTSAPFNVIAGGTSLPRLRFARSLTCAMLQPEMGASMGTESGGLFVRAVVKVVAANKGKSVEIHATSGLSYHYLFILFIFTSMTY
jgi:hypothetical protein